jgi:hypothetical protein
MSLTMLLATCPFTMIWQAVLILGFLISFRNPYPFFVAWCLGGYTVTGKLIYRFKIFNADAVRKGFAIGRFTAPFYLR